MGLFNKPKKEFAPSDLSANKIQHIFDRCVATEKTAHPYPIRLKESDDKSLVTFDLDMIDKETKLIRYLLGQLKALHEDRETIHLSELTRKYDGTSIFDEDDKVTPIQLVALGIGSISTSALSGHNYVSFLTSKKTLSPYDPAFKTWWAEHKAEWEE